MKFILYFGVILLFGKCDATRKQYIKVPYSNKTDVYNNGEQYEREQCDLAVKDAFNAYKIVYDVVTKAPCVIAVVRFDNGISMFLGNPLFGPTAQPIAPYVSWPFNPSKYYTLILLNADVPARENRVESSYIQWLVVNIPGDDISAGTTIFRFAFTAPEYRFGFHRYVLVVYQQSSTLNPRNLFNSKSPSRYRFSAMAFAIRNNLGFPVAGNFGVLQFSDTCNPN